MQKRELLEVTQNIKLTDKVGAMVLKSDNKLDLKAGQFVNLKLDGLYLRRPISVCDISDDKHSLTLVYKAVGRGTCKMLDIKPHTRIDALMGLGNGFDITTPSKAPLLIGGGIGLAPLYYLCKCLISQNKRPVVVLGFANAEERYYESEFKGLGVPVNVTTVDGSYGIKGFVTAAFDTLSFDYYYACGPEPMLKSVWQALRCDGQLSFERRMGCGFGACMGCSCKTITGSKRICVEGPVLKKGEVVF